MKSRIFICAIFFIVIGVGSIAYVCYAVSKSSGHPNTVTLVFSGGELGYLEPCGCSEGQLGGIARRDSFLQHLRKNENIILPIANGNFIKDNLPQSELKADVGFLALADMGYIAYNVGERDLLLGTSQLTAFSEQNQIPFISANLYQGTSPVFMPYLLHTVQLPENAVRIAIVGFISPTYAVYAENTGLHIREPHTILKTLMPELTQNADVVVCLFHGTEGEASNIRTGFPRLDVVVISNDKTEPLSSLVHPDRHIVNTSTKGKAICSVKIYQDVNGPPIVESPQQHLLNEQIPDSQRMTDLLALYQQMVADQILTESVPRAQPEKVSQFVGSTACKTCHIEEWKSWKATKHSHAYHTLEVAGHETDPDCLTCHTVGFGFLSGFLSIEKTPNHLDVGCENCHGAGNSHVKQQSETSHTKKAGYGEVTETTCLTCHTTENSPKFDFTNYFPKIVHTIVAENAHETTH